MTRSLPVFRKDIDTKSGGMEISSEFEEGGCHHHPGGSRRNSRRSSGRSRISQGDGEDWGRGEVSSGFAYYSLHVNRPVVHQLDLYAKFKECNQETGKKKDNKFAYYVLVYSVFKT